MRSDGRHVVLVHLLGSGANPLYQCWEAVCLDCRWQVDTDGWRDAAGNAHRMTKDGVEGLRRRHEAEPEWVPDRAAGCIMPSGCAWCGWETTPSP